MRMTKWAFLAGLLCSGLFTTGNLLAEQTDTAKADSGLLMTAEFPAERTDTVAKFSAVQSDTGKEPEEEEIATVEEDEAQAVETVEYIEPEQPISEHTPWEQMPGEQTPGEQTPVDNSEPGVFSLASLEALAESAPPGVADEFTSSEMVSFDGGGFNASSVGPCCSVCGGGSNCPPGWYTEHGVRNLGRSKPRPMQLTGEFLNARSDDDFTSSIVVPSWQLLRADDPNTAEEDSMWQWRDFRSILPRTNLRAMGFQNAPGYTVTLGRYLGRDSANRDQFIEFTYWGLNHWDTSRETNGLLQPEYTNEPNEGFSERTVTGLTNKGSTVTYPGENPGDPTETRLLRTPPIARYSGSLRSPYLLSTELTDEQPEFATNPDLVAMALALDISFNNVLQHTMAYTSTANDFELNARLRPRGRADRLVLDPNGKWRRECQPGNYMSYLFGLRVMSIDEAFHFGSNGTTTSFRYAEPEEVQDPNNPQADPITTYEVLEQFDNDVRGDYDVRTHNDLFGFQIGADLIYRKCRWRYGFKAKAGPYVNFSDQYSRITTDEVTLPGIFPDDADQTFAAQNIPRRGRKNSIALLAEVGFVGEYRIRPNMNLRAAYDFMWITGLALAPEQMQFRPDPTSAVNTNGHIFSHGITLTAEWMW